jgi:nucleotide-binding universal stress UspA family protein
MKVLYATDGFAPALDAERLLTRLASRERAEVTVMSVTHAGVPALEHAVLVLDPIEERRHQSIEIVDAAVERLRAAGFSATGRTGEGQPGPEILQAVEQDWFDLIVVGAGRKGWLGSHLLGSVSLYLLHSAPCSVLVVHEVLGDDSPVRILVGTDGSRGTEFTIRSLTGFADPDRCEVTAACVVADPVPFLVPVPGGPSPSPQFLEYDKELTQHLYARGKRNAENATTRLRDAGFMAEPAVLVGHPAEQLLKEAQERGFDLVAVGSRGTGPVRRALLGSVSDQVARHARSALVGRRLVT